MVRGNGTRMGKVVAIGWQEGLMADPERWRDWNQVRECHHSKKTAKKIWQVRRYDRTRFSHHVERGYDLAVYLADLGEERQMTAGTGIVEELSWHSVVVQVFLAGVRS